ncbi:MAG: phosphoribosyl-ATP diphosphatase [Jiangellaceae bacterium]
MKSFDGLWVELSAKVAASAEGSATVEAVRRGVHDVGKKIVEEAAEAWMAAEHESADRAADEIAQLLYHVQVLMLVRGIDLDDVYARL